jgi:hypothetical protein
MSLLPDKNLFIVTSALKPNIGVISNEDRFIQTVQSLESLRKHLPNDFIVLADGSPNEVEEEKYKELIKYVNGIVPWHYDSDVKNFAMTGQKSAAEIVLLFKMLILLKRDLDLSQMLAQSKRIFKYSARTTLHDSFDITKYDNLFGKYVFKKRISTWMQDQRKEVVDHLLITRMFSFCPSLIDNYMMTLHRSLNDVMKYGIDTEHAHYNQIDKKYLIEFDTLHCEGIMAGSGEIERY